MPARIETYQAAASRRCVPATGRVVARALRNLAAQDAILLVFHSYMLTRACTAPFGPARQPAVIATAALWAITAVTIVSVRGEILRPGFARALLYRFGTVGPAISSYVSLGWLLPAITPPVRDGMLLAIDEALFGVTPAIPLQQIAVVPVIEWFSFFYLTYFPLLAVVVLPCLFFGRGQSQRELMVAIAVVTCGGHVGYTLVPALGPHQLALFDEPLRGGFWWTSLERIVAEGSIRMDIFPSLHTAYPVVFALHAFAHRGQHRAGGRRALALSFVAANIVIATLLLRWHYAVDVVAGLVVAILARQIAVAIATRESVRGVVDDRQPVWEPLPMTPDSARARAA